MSAQDFGIVAIVLPNPQFDPSVNAQVVNATYGFELHAGDVIRTLSANNPNNYALIQGLLYVPDLLSSGSCGNQTAGLIPSNVTRRADFPPDDYPFVALAPWTTKGCVQSYLSSMRADNVRGAIFFHPDNSSVEPAPVSDPSWSLYDGGGWKSQNPFPVYAIPGMLGSFLMQELAQYSGNMTQVPFGDQLAHIYHSYDTVRLYARMDVSQTTGLPSLWVFLIIVLAILLAIVLATSVVMHFIQRRQRLRLQRRVANGEVDLEALGIKRLNVSQELIDQMPRYTYTSKAETSGLTNTTDKAGKPAREVAFSQPTCPICLEDFVHGETSIRELPCNHIFHPECIDIFLRDNSSLCPMCKKSALPAGVCPVHVTNLMVRRERLMRRVRERALAHQGIRPGQSISSRLPPWAQLVQRRVEGLNLIPAPVPAHFGSASGAHGTGQEMQPVRSSTAPVNSVTAEAQPVRRSTAPTGFVRDEETPPAEVQSQGRAAVRAWRRERLARRQMQEFGEHAVEAREVDMSRPAWRRFTGRFIPSLE